MKTLKDYKEQYEALEIKKNLKGEEALAAVKQDGYALQYVAEKYQSEAVCLEAVKKELEEWKKRFNDSFKKRELMIKEFFKTN